MSASGKQSMICARSSGQLKHEKLTKKIPKNEERIPYTQREIDETYV